MSEIVSRFITYGFLRMLGEPNDGLLFLKLLFSPITVFFCKFKRLPVLLTFLGSHGLHYESEVKFLFRSFMLYILRRFFSHFAGYVIHDVAISILL